MKQLVVGALIIDDLSSPSVVLAARRTSPPTLRGKWEFPGGKVEDGERPKDALARELKEELGFEAVLGMELETPTGGVWRISDGLEMRLWFAVIRDGTPIPIDSHDELRWLDADSLEAVDWLDGDRQVLPFVFPGRDPTHGQ